jgi:hypothetical protein
LAIDAAGNCFVVGNFAGTIDFDPSPASYNLTYSTGADIFTAMYTSSGNLVYVVPFSGGGVDNGRTIICDSYGNVTLGGYFFGTIDANPDTATISLTSNGSQDFFIGHYTNLNPLTINSPANEDEFRRFPVPATTYLTLEIPEFYFNPVFNCVDISGHSIELNTQRIGSNSFKFDTSQLPPGMYFIVAADEKNLKTIKFIK